jgi:hypothetical protein
MDLNYQGHSMTNIPKPGNGLRMPRKNMIFKIAIISLMIALTGCDIEEIPTVTRGSEITDVEGFVRLERSATRLGDLPPQAENIIYLGGHWFSFSRGEDCFIIRDRYRYSVMARVPCSEPTK